MPPTPRTGSVIIAQGKAAEAAALGSARPIPSRVLILCSFEDVKAIVVHLDKYPTIFSLAVQEHRWGFSTRIIGIGDFVFPLCGMTTGTTPSQQKGAGHDTKHVYVCEVLFHKVRTPKIDFGS